MRRSAWLRLRTVSMVMASLLLLLSSAVPASAVTTPLNKNIVKNAGAEKGVGRTDGNQSVAIPSWTHAPQAPTRFTVVKYGSPNGYPTVAEGQRISGRNQFFAGGLGLTSSTCAGLKQTIPIKGRNSLIDSSHLRVQFGAWIATFDNQTDAGRARLDYLNKDGAGLGHLDLPTLSKTNGVFTLNVRTALLPFGTRKLVVLLDPLDAHQGAECDAYFDNIQVMLIQQ